MTKPRINIEGNVALAQLGLPNLIKKYNYLDELATDSSLDCQSRVIETEWGVVTFTVGGQDEELKSIHIVSPFPEVAGEEAKEYGIKRLPIKEVKGIAGEGGKLRFERKRKEEYIIEDEFPIPVFRLTDENGTGVWNDRHEYLGSASMNWNGNPYAYQEPNVRKDFFIDNYISEKEQEEIGELKEIGSNLIHRDDSNYTQYNNIIKDNDGVPVPGPNPYDYAPYYGCREEVIATWYEEWEFGIEMWVTKRNICYGWYYLWDDCWLAPLEYDYPYGNNTYLCYGKNFVSRTSVDVTFRTRVLQLWVEMYRENEEESHTPVFGPINIPPEDREYENGWTQNWSIVLGGDKDGHVIADDFEPNVSHRIYIKYRGCAIHNDISFTDITRVETGASSVEVMASAQIDPNKIDLGKHSGLDPLTQYIAIVFIQYETSNSHRRWERQGTSADCGRWGDEVVTIDETAVYPMELRLYVEGQMFVLETGVNYYNNDPYYGDRWTGNCGMYIYGGKPVYLFSYYERGYQYTKYGFFYNGELYMSKEYPSLIQLTEPKPWSGIDPLHKVITLDGETLYSTGAFKGGYWEEKKITEVEYLDVDNLEFAE